MRAMPQRLLLASGLVALGMAFFLAAGSAWLGTDSGRAWLALQIQERTAGSVRIEGLQGHPLGAWSAERVDFEEGESRLWIDRLAVDWNPWGLMLGRLHLRGVTAEAVRLTLPEKTASGSGGLELPAISVQLDSFRLATAEIFDGPHALATLSAVELEKVRLGQALVGGCSLRYDGWLLNGTLRGKPDGWTAQLAADGAGDMHLALTLKGNRLEQGSLELFGDKALSRLKLSGSWSMHADELESSGDVTLRQDAWRHAGAWALRMNTASGAMQARLDAGTEAELLSRPLRWSSSGIREPDGNWHGEFSEAVAGAGNQGLQLQWTWLHGGSFTAQGNLEHWPMPLRGANGEWSGGFSGGFSDAGWSFDADIRDGSIAGLHAMLDVRARGDGEAWELQRGRMQWLGLKLTASGQGNGGHVRLKGLAEATDMQPILAFAGVEGAGRLKGSFTLEGDAPSPELAWHADVYAASVDGVAMHRITAGGRWIQARREGEIRLAASGLRWNDRRWQALRLNAMLGRDAAAMQGEATGDIGALWRLHAQRRNDGWQGRFDRFEIRDASAVLLSVSGIPWVFSQGILNVERSPLRVVGQTGWVDVNHEGQDVMADLQFPEFSLHALQPWLRGPLRDLDGHAELRAHLGGTLESPVAEIQLRAGKVVMNIADDSGRLPQPVLRQMLADLHAGQGGLGWKASLDMPAAGRLEVSGDIPWLFTLSPFVFRAANAEEGQVRLLARLDDLAVLQPWLERVDPLSGKARVNMVIDRPLGEAALSGSGDFDIPALGIPEFGMDLSGKGKVSWNGDAGKVDMRLVSGSGQMQATGPFSLSGKRFPDVSFQHFTLMNTTDQQLVVDGTLAARNRDGHIWLSGELTADPLSVVLPEAQPGATRDLVWGEAKPSDARIASLRRTRLDVRLDLGGHGLVIGRGMRLQLGGSLTFGGSVAYPRLTGDLQILSGGIDYRNIHLDVLPDSHVTFTGDPDRPLLHVRAGRKVDGKWVGVSMDGPADRPMAELVSSPAMPQAEILSYLATGRPLASLGQNGASDAMSLAGFLLGPGSAVQGVQDKIRQGLGLDELAVQTGTESNRVAAAKRIGEKATVRLEEVVTTQASTAVTLEYKLLNSLSVFARKVQNLAPTVGLKLGLGWQGQSLQDVAGETSLPADAGP